MKTGVIDMYGNLKVKFDPQQETMTHLRATFDHAFAIASGTSSPHVLIQYNDIDYDVLDEWDTTNYRFNPRYDGYYQVTFSIMLDTTTAWNTEQEAFIGYVYKNGTTAYPAHRMEHGNSGGATVYTHATGSLTLYLTTDDYIDIRMWQNSGASINTWTGGNYNFVNVDRLPDEQGAVKSETLTHASLVKTAAQSITSGGSAKKLTWDSTPTYDVLSEWDNTNHRLTATYAGYYHVDLSVLLGPSTAWTAWSEICSLYIYKNGSYWCNFDRNPHNYGGVQDYVHLAGSITLHLDAGDYIEAYIYQNSGSTISTYASAYYCKFTIDRLPDVQGAPSPHWEQVTKLVAPDGDPDPALYIQDDGSAIGMRNHYITAGYDILPNGFGHGLAKRAIHNNNLSVTEHFHTNTIPSGYSWQGSPWYGTPSSVNYSHVGDFLLAIQSTSSDGYLATTTGSARGMSLSMRGLPMYTVGACGLRIDDGTNNNYYELYCMPNGTGTVSLRLRERVGGGTVTTVSTSVLWPLWQMPPFNLLCYSPSPPTHQGLCYYMLEDGSVTSSGMTGTTSVTWTPARHGIVFPNTGSYIYGLIDYYDSSVG